MGVVSIEFAPVPKMVFIRPDIKEEDNLECMQLHMHSGLYIIIETMQKRPWGHYKTCRYQNLLSTTLEDIDPMPSSNMQLKDCIYHKHHSY